MVTIGKVASALFIGVLGVLGFTVSRAEASTPQEIQVWQIEMWNQAITDAAGPYQSPECRDMVLYMQRVHGYNEYDLRTWKYIGTRESRCHLWAINISSRTHDWSVCWFQINFYGSLYYGRARQFGPPDYLRSNPNACAAAASAFFDARRFRDWGM